MKLSTLVLIIILLVAFSLRLYRINNPLADWHSWRQADTAAVSRNFVKFGFDILHPRFDDLSNVASGQENPEGYRFVEFPIYNLIHAFLLKLAPFWSLEVWGRLVSIIGSLISLWLLYLLVKEQSGELVALLTAFFFAILPFNIYYSRVILPEPLMITMSLAALYFFDRFWLLSAGFASLAVLLKPFAAFWLAPAWLCLNVRKKVDKNQLARTFIYLLITIGPFCWWRWWMSHFPQGIPVNDWLFNAQNIRFKGAFFYWLFADRLARLILGYWGMILFGLGLIVKVAKKSGWFFHSWLAGILIYFVVIASGNVQHDYYQLLAVPVICVFLGQGAAFLLKVPKRHFYRPLAIFLLIAAILFTFAFSWYHVRDFFNINNSTIVKAGQAVDELVPPEAKVIAPYGGDTAFLYQTNRRGWPIGIEIEKFIKLGATHYVNVNFGPETEWMMSQYKILERTNDYVIVEIQ